MTKEIERPEKWIKLRVSLATDNLEKFTKNKKTAWAYGTVTVFSNRSRGIRPVEGRPEWFKSIDELPKVIKKVIKKHGISLVNYDKDTKKMYLVELD